MNIHMKVYIGFLIILVGLFIISISSCDADSKIREHKSEVDAVYWHEGSRFTVIKINEDGKLSFIVLPSKSEGVNTEVIIDAVDTCWYEYYYKHDYKGNKGWCKIHLTSLDDLRPADWNHGKLGSGSTVRVR